MADFQTTVELKAQTQHLDRALKKTTKQIDGVKKEVMKTQGVFKKFGENASKSIAKVDAAFAKHKGAITGVFAAISGAILKGTSDLKKWEDGLTQIETLGVKGMKEVEKQLVNVRKTYGVTGKEATKGYYDIISAGAKEGIEAQEQLNAAIQLAKAGNTDLTKAVDILTSGINVWKSAGISATDVTDKLFLAVKYGKTTVEELGATFGRVAPLSQAAGASIDDYATSMAVLTANGFKTEDATTGLKGAFGGMLKVTEGAKKAAEGLNIEWENAGTTWGTSAVQAEGFENVLLKLNKAITDQAVAQGLNVAQTKAFRASTITKLFEDKTAAASIITLTGNIEKFSAILGDMKNSAGTTAEAYKKTQKDLSFHLGKFNQSLAVLSETIGKNFKPALLSIVKAITPIVDAFQTLVAENPGLIATAAAITAVATSLAFFGTFKTGVFGLIVGGLILISKNFTKFADSGTEAIHKIQVVWNDWWRGFSDNTYVQGVADSLKSITGAFDALPDIDLGDMLSGDFDWEILKVELENSWIYIKSWFLELKNGVTKWAKGAADGAKSAFSNFASILPSISLDDILSGDWDIISVELENFWIHLKSGFLSVANALQEIDWIKAIVDGIAKAIDWVIVKVTSFGKWLIFGSYWTDMLAAVSSATEGWDIGKTFDNVITAIKTSFADAKSTLGAGLAIAGITITDTSAISYWDNLKASMSNYMDTLTTKSKTAANALAKFEGSAGLQKAASGLILVKEAAQDTGASVLKSANSWIKSTLEIGKQKRALQKLIQTQRELQASFVKYADLSTATEAKTTLALENSSKIRNTFINERIAKYRTLGREIGKIKEGQVGAEIAKGVDALGDKLKGRGFMSRFLFGEGTLITWEQKLQGLMGRVGGLFDKLGTKTTQGIGKLQTLSAEAKAADAAKGVAKAQQAVGLNKAAVEATKANAKALAEAQKALTNTTKNLMSAESKLATAMNQSAATSAKNATEAAKVTKTATARKEVQLLQKTLASNEAAVKAAAKEVQIGKALSTRVTLLQKAQAALNAANTKLVNATAQITKASQGAVTLRTESAAFAKAIQSLKFGEAITHLNAAFAGSTKIQKGAALIGATLGGVGTVIRAGAEGLSAVLPKLNTFFGGVSKFTGISATMGAVAKIAQPALNILKKVAVPLIAVFGAIDAYKGFTDLDLAAKILGKSKGFDVSKLTTYDKSIAAASNAFGKFFDGFADLAGSAITYLGGDVLGKMLKDVELAPEFAKIFTIIGNLFDTIVNIGKAIAGAFSGDKGESSVMTDLLVGLVKFLSWLLTFLANTTEAIAKLTGGDLKGAWDSFSSSFSGIFDGLIDGIKTAVMSSISSIADKITGMFDSLVTAVSGYINTASFGLLGTAAPVDPAAEQSAQNAKHQATYDKGPGGTGRSGNAQTKAYNKAKAALGYADGGAVGYSSKSYTPIDMEEVFGFLDDFEGIPDQDYPFEMFDDIEAGIGDLNRGQIENMFLDNGLKKYANGGAVSYNDKSYTPIDMEEVFGFLDDFQGIPDQDYPFEMFDDIETGIGKLNRGQIEDMFLDNGLKKYANGGKVKGRGTGRSDSIPAMLSNGEFVLNAKSAEMFRPLLEKMNAVGLANGGSVGDAKARQYLQFSGEGKGSLDVEKTMEMFINNLDAANPKVGQVVQKMQWLANATNNSTKQEILNEAYTRDINGLLNNLVNPEMKKLAETSKDASGSVLDLGKAADESKNEWKGMGRELTGPIKQAFLEGGSIGDGIKQGMHNLFKSISGKLMDRIMKPLEDSIDTLLNDMFGTTSEGKGTSSSPMITKDVNDTGLGGILGGGKAGGSEETENPLVKAIKGTTSAVMDGTSETGGFFDSIGSIFSSGFDWISEAFSGLGSMLSGLGGSGGSGGGGGIGGFFSSLFGGGGGGHSMIDGIGVSSFFARGGIVPKKGMRPQYFANGGMARGTDTVPAMLTPGEMVLNKDQQKGMGQAPVTINQTLNITEAMDPQKFQQELVKNNKVVVGLVQQSYQKRGQMGPQGYGQ